MQTSDIRRCAQRAPALLGLLLVVAVAAPASAREETMDYASNPCQADAAGDYDICLANAEASFLVSGGAESADELNAAELLCWEEKAMAGVDCIGKDIGGFFRRLVTYM